MATHEATCPGCGAGLLVSVFQHLGGSVEENVDVALAQPAPVTLPPAPAPETPQEVSADA